MRIGYGRTSTVDQQAGLDAQIRDLKAAGCEEIFAERISSVAACRPKLEELLQFTRKGDTVVVTRLDRLARSTRDLLELRDRIRCRGAELMVLNLGCNTGTATGELVMTVIGAIAAFERSLMLERQREGIAKAKELGKYTGRQPTARRQAAEARRLLAEGLGKAEVARLLGIARSSLYRILGEDEK
jgi:DNA invertase Pin-like site-specific DNA recombinase